MPTSAQTLAKFVADLTFSAIPQPVVEHAKVSIIDAVAVAAFGSQMPWSAMAADYARRYGSGGPCSLVGMANTRVHAPYAALANGVFAHAFEQDSTHDPNVGAHAGATLLPVVLAACEEANADGKTAITAFVAGCEVMFRVGAASHRSKTGPEALGFHAPGLTGPYGAAVAAGRVFGLNAEQLTHALGIAGSLSAGLLAFAKSQHGGMVKRLHFGRAAESGILAARLAAAGYTGPESVLEGKFGFLEAYSREGNPALLTADLHKDWETTRISMKRYACHVTAQAPLQALRTLMAEHGFMGAGVAGIVVEGPAKVVSHHNIKEPGDLMQAQYSLPFCIALGLYRDPDDPKSFDASAVSDPAIRAACRNVELRQRAQPGPSSWSARIIVKLKDGRELTHEGNSFKGMLIDPLTREELRRKFMLLTRSMDAGAAAQLFERLDQLEAQPRFSVA